MGPPDCERVNVCCLKPQVCGPLWCSPGTYTALCRALNSALALAVVQRAGSHAAGRPGSPGPLLVGRRRCWITDNRSLEAELEPHTFGLHGNLSRFASENQRRTSGNVSLRSPSASTPGTPGLPTASRAPPASRCMSPERSKERGRTGARDSGRICSDLGPMELKTTRAHSVPEVGVALSCQDGDLAWERRCGLSHRGAHSFTQGCSSGKQQIRCDSV